MNSHNSPKAIASPDGKPVIAFASTAKLQQWVAKNHTNHTGFWLRIFKKGSEQPTLTYAEALDVALAKSPKAATFFTTLNKANRYAIYKRKA